ncbi:MAG TPA: hypothetical protein VLG44_08565, partial [Chlamydiales bacterium]|nr:hypothetical protein [Chlamydiales bacterium]
MRRYILPFLFLIALLEAKLPDIAPRDVKVKMDGILKAHATHKKMSPELFKRAMNNFIEELDPMKTYFLASELDPWLKPSDDLLKKTLDD